MASRSTLLLLFTWNDVPLACIWDNAKDMIQGKFYLNDAAFHLKQSEPHTTFLNVAEREIKEFKKGAG